LARILITCFGSYGDLYPYVAIGRALQTRGHQVTLGTAKIYQDKLAAEGLAFCHLRCAPDRLTTPEQIRGFLQDAFDGRRGAEKLVRAMTSSIEETYLDTRAAARNADLVISHPLAFATPIVCRELRIAWLSTMLAPMFFLSTVDPPVIGGAPWLRPIHTLSPRLYRSLFRLLRRSTDSWVQPIAELCRRRGLAALLASPLFEGQYSPQGTLALFPSALAQRQPDWPPNTIITGFPLHSSEEANPQTLRSLEAFLRGGEAPLVFALGSSAVHIARDFFVVSAQAARRLSRRAVLVTGAQTANRTGLEAADDLFIIDYVAYDQLFPHASVLIHQGGIGTLAQALQARRPMLVVPFGFDQHDNAHRVTRLGVALTLSRKDYLVDKVAAAIDALARRPSFARAAALLGARVQAEDGIANACAAVEALLAAQTRRPVAPANS